MLELQVPLLAAKALILLLLFAFIYAVMSRSIGDLRKIPDDEPYVPGRGHNGRGSYARRGSVSGMPELGDEDTSMGRSSGSTIVLRSDDYASGRHAQLTRHGGLLYVEDLGSTNGTFVNGRKTVGATPLRNGDTVTVGSTTFRYEE